MALLYNPTSKIGYSAAGTPMGTNVAESPNAPPPMYSSPPPLPPTAIGYLNGQNGVGNTYHQPPITTVGPAQSLMRNWGGPAVQQVQQYLDQSHGPIPTPVNPNGPATAGGPAPGKISVGIPERPNPTVNQTPPPTPSVPNNPSGIDYRSIFNFMPTAEADNMVMSHPELGASNRGAQTYINPNSEGDWTDAQRAEVTQLQQAGIISRQLDSNGNYGDWQINWDKLPQAQVGGKPINAMYLAPTDSTGSNLINPNLRAHDSAYGDVTPSSNNNAYKMNGLDAFLYNALPSAFMGGIGMMTAPVMGSVASQLMKVPQMIQGIANGGNVWGALANAALGAGENALGVPSVARPIIQYGVNQAVNGFNRGGKS